jgi:hypothetical protein
MQPNDERDQALENLANGYQTTMQKAGNDSQDGGSAGSLALLVNDI